ncbi:hypothetical protein [Salipaludibacillus sp. CF4.18]|uniref:hypothetical protein n=1 Tax=Salipaludibacillus sp. CF4.18 TaxID=3373081 RepID=UPI003EE5CF3C
MDKYIIKNTRKSMWIQSIVSSNEIVETNQFIEALVFENENEAQEVCRKLTNYSEEQFEVILNKTPKK